MSTEEKYLCTIQFTTTHVKRFHSEEEFIKWAKGALPNEDYVTVDETNEEAMKDTQELLDQDYDGQGFKVPINTPSKVLALIAYDLEHEGMSVDDFDAVPEGTTVKVLRLNQ